MVSGPIDHILICVYKKNTDFTCFVVVLLGGRVIHVGVR